MTWREEQHPRRPRGSRGGEFVGRHRALGWADVVSDEIGMGRGEHVRTRGVGLHELLTPDDWSDLSRRTRLDSVQDEALADIYRRQGFHAPPEVLSREQIDQRVADGWVETWRGFGGALYHPSGTTPTTVEQGTTYAQDYRTGDKHHAGKGMYGNGTYSSDEKEEGAIYAGWDPVYDAERKPVDLPDRMSALGRILISPQARIVDEDELRRLHMEATPRGTQSDQLYTMRDLGRTAALLGYDVIRGRRGESRIPGRDHRYNYIILNRSATAVEQAQP